MKTSLVCELQLHFTTTTTTATAAELVIINRNHLQESSGHIADGSETTYENTNKNVSKSSDDEDGTEDSSKEGDSQFEVAFNTYEGQYTANILTEKNVRLSFKNS